MTGGIVFFVKRRSTHHYRAADAFIAGLECHGLTARVEENNNVVDADLAVIWGMRHETVINRQIATGRRFLVIEQGYIDRSRFWSLGYDGLNGRADFCLDQAKPSGRAWRWRSWVKRLKPWRPLDQPGRVVVFGQVPGDKAVEGLDLLRWYSGALSTLKRSWPGVEICFRPHPLATGVRPKGYDRILAAGLSLEDVLKDCRLAVTYSSNAGVDAVLAGVPVCAVDRGSMAWRMATHDMADLPMHPERKGWLHDIAHCQWTVEEIERGEAWDHLRAGMPESLAA